MNYSSKKMVSARNNQSPGCVLVDLFSWVFVLFLFSSFFCLLVIELLLLLALYFVVVELFFFFFSTKIRVISPENSQPPQSRATQPNRGFWLQLFELQAVRTSQLNMPREKPEQLPLCLFSHEAKAQQKSENLVDSEQDLQNK